jgi:hypothetical protein
VARRRPESNWCKRLCRPLRSHSATAPGATPSVAGGQRAQASARAPARRKASAREGSSRGRRPRRAVLSSPLPGRLAQLGERRLDKAEVTGSSPVSPTRKALLSGAFLLSGLNFGAQSSAWWCARFELAPVCRMTPQCRNPIRTGLSGRGQAYGGSDSHAAWSPSGRGPLLRDARRGRSASDSEDGSPVPTQASVGAHRESTPDLSVEPVALPRLHRDVSGERVQQA